MANVLFKRGLKANLPDNASKGNVIDGSLYFTTDTCQLYLGHNTALLPIGDNIRIVSATTDLGNAADHRHEFAYVETGNILAWSNGSAWKQTNPNTENDTLTASVDANGNVTIDILDTKGGHATGSFKIEAASNNVTIGKNDTTGALTISVAPDQNTTYSFTSTTTEVEVHRVVDSQTVTSTVSTVNLNLVPSEGNTQAVSVIAGTGINVGMLDGKVQISVNESEISGISTVTLGAGTAEHASGTSTNAGMHIEIATANNDFVSGWFDPTITYGENHDQTAHMRNGATQLDVYTTSEIDSLITELEQGLNAMVYRGVANSATDITNLTDIKNGDTWKANGTFTIDGQTVRPGYVIIAQGTEGSDGYIPAADRSFDVIVGDATDTTYTVSSITNGIKIMEEGGDQIGSIAILGTAGDITAVESGSTDKTVTLDLATVSQAATSTTTFNQASGRTSSVVVIDSISVDSKGRVTGMTKKDLVLVDNVTHISEVTPTVTTTNDVATIAIQVKDDQGGNESGSFSIGSSGSLSVTSVSEAITVDLVWGSF